MTKEEENKREYEAIIQELLTEGMRLFSAGAGLIVDLCLVGFGIYFSQYAFSMFFGNSDLMFWFTLTVSIMISVMKTTLSTTYSNELRAITMKENNRLVFSISSVFTFFLFVFDIVSNVYGLFLTAKEFLGTTPPLVGWILIIFLSFFTVFSEVIAIWIILNFASNFAGWKSALKKWEAIEKAKDNEIKSNAGASSRPAIASGNGNR